MKRFGLIGFAIIGVLFAFAACEKSSSESVTKRELCNELSTAYCAKMNELTCDGAATCSEQWTATCAQTFNDTCQALPEDVNAIRTKAIGSWIADGQSCEEMNALGGSLLDEIIYMQLRECADGGSPVADGDEEAFEDDTLLKRCSGDEDCKSGVCFQLGDAESWFCTMPCTSDSVCRQADDSACCLETSGGSNICFPPLICREIPTDGDAEEEQTTECTPNERFCSDRNEVVQCGSTGDSYFVVEDCGAKNATCQIGACVPNADGDIDGDVDGDDDGENANTCGDPDITPGSTLRRAEILFAKAKSNPSDDAEIHATENTDFSDGTYVWLTLPGRDSGPQDSQGNDQELVFDIDIDYTYQYDIIVDFVCGQNWGQAALYLDDANEPLLREEGIRPEDYVELNCTISDPFDQEKLVTGVLYRTVCLEEGEHVLRVRVDGKESESEGYTLGVDYIKILPHYDNEPPGSTR